jgi:hypothetical protein
MRFDYHSSEFCFTIDLHATTFWVCILDHAGPIVCAQTLPAGPDAFLGSILPSATTLSSLANACSAGAGSPTRAECPWQSPAVRLACGTRRNAMSHRRWCSHVGT